ncbi:MAG: class I SAM-dependent methyltransferase [Methanocellales archaeon]|nr:class I SAM-dependent methyltransferase [Methanocellales archaeon]MDD3291644.1 class I SAM-dependent methyltransferase [Methanocellales archaeon]MDD5235213.1 class I SAM-dependent methyltransferase [Methanocellales archaeon]MDD5485427.1 class I SAM-dependent methyltransferase [Methanocellales archaeon]
MEDKKQLSPENISAPGASYFELQAYWGVTKHMGGLKATRELIELCHISKDKYVLVVGCGIGTTPCYIAKRYGCKVVGMDLSERMVDRFHKKTKRERVEHRVECMVADAQNLPFDDAIFDAVLCESVNAFVEDKQRAASEYMRVTKSGGYVGLNECIWMKVPPPELVEYISRIMGAEFPTCSWKELLEGLSEVVARIYKVGIISQWIDEVRQTDFLDFLRAWCRFLFLLLKSSDCRRFSKEALAMPKSIFGLFEYFGYEICVGRK